MCALRQLVPLKRCSVHAGRAKAVSMSKVSGDTLREGISGEAALAMQPVLPA